MFKLVLTTLLMGSLLSGCVTTTDAPITEPTPEPSKEEFAKIDQQLVDLETKLSNKITQSCDQKLGVMSENIDVLSNKIDEYRRAKKGTKIVNRCSNREGTRTLGDKFIMGSVEKVHLTKEKLELDARIDTGADASSMGVYGVKRFERDGKKWVRFSMNEKAEAEVYEYPIYDNVKIKQSRTVSEDRIEIKVDIEMGGVSYKKQLFNLADRSHLAYQLLIGRSFLRDIAVVDVSRQRLLRAN